MQMRRSVLCLLAALVLLPLNLSGGGNFPYFRFRHYTVDDGLSVNTVTSIIQDRQGFMWFGTSMGINCYDGKTFRHFLPTTYESGLKGINDINSLSEGYDDELLAGTASGLYIFDKKQEKFTRAGWTTSDGTGITSTVYATIVAPDGSIWIATYGQGVFRYDYGTGSMTQFLHNPDDRWSIPSDNIRNLFIDSRNRIWILTYDNGIGCMLPGEEKCIRYIGHGTSISERYDVACEDSEGNLWFGNYTEGISLLNPSTGEFRHFLTTASHDGITHVRCIVEYAKGKLLLASDSGLTMFDTGTYGHRTIRSSLSDISGLNDDYVHSIFIDKEQGVWIGTYFGGVNYSPASSKNFKHYSPCTENAYFPGKVVGTMRQDNSGKLWVATDDAGVICFDIMTGEYRQYLPEKGRNSISYHNIHALLCDGDKVWIGTYSKGLDCLDLRTGLFRNYMHDDSKENSLINPSVYALYKDSKGTIWIGTPAGACTYGKDSDSFTRIKETEGADISCIAEDCYGYLWFSSLNGGIFRYNPFSEEWKRYGIDENDGKPAGTVTTIYTSPSGELFAGTAGYGIARYDYGEDRFVLLEVPALNSTCIHSIIDSDIYMWISTNNGIVRLHKRTLDTKTYNTSDGLQSLQFSPNSGIMLDDGTICFGGINGLNRFNPDHLVENTVIPGVYISGLRLFNKKISCGDRNGILDSAISYKDGIVLRHDQSFVSFEFVSLSYMAPDKNQYAYRLEGFDKDWTLPHEESVATYTNIPPGEYVFRVIGANNDGLWNKTGASINVKVLPPWYASKWAFALYALAALLTATFVLRSYVRKIEKQHRKNIEQIKSDKEKELYDTKINFYTNIIHEIRTPLSLIIGPLEHIMKSGKRVSEVKDELNVMHRNAIRLLSLVNQLLDFRKIESRNMDEIILKPIDMAVLSNQIYRRFLPAASQKGIEMLIDVQKNGMWIKGDTEALTKIISNLLSNAIKFTGNKVVLTVSFPDEGQSIMIKCEDNGKGVPESERENIFKPFYQIKENQPTDGIGTGVGLSLVKSLIAQMCGSIKVGQSSMGGASFIVTLPMIPADNQPEGPVAEESVPAAQEATDEQAAENEKNAISKPAVMLVDDNKDMLSFLSKSMIDWYDIVTYSNAPEALEYCRSNNVDVIISDVMMPEVNGFEFCRLLKEEIRTSHIPVIMLTAKIDVESKITGLDCGADVYIEKPFSVDHLKAQIRSLLINRRNVQRNFSNSTSFDVSSLATTRADMEFLQKVDDFINTNLTDTSFTAGDIAHHVGLSRSAFFQKLRAVSGLTPSDYVRLIRLKKAAEYFNAGEDRVNEVCFLTGFNSPSYFAKCFQNQFGVLPVQYIKDVAGGKQAKL